MEIGIGGGSGSGASAAANLDPSRKLPRSTTGLAPVSTTSAVLGRAPGSPTPAGSPPTSGQTQQVLHNFFQSLLNSKDRAGVNAAALRTPTSPKPNGSTAEEGSA